MTPDAVVQLEAVGLSRATILDAWLGLVPNVLGIVVYLVFIFEFYRFVARRDVFALRLRRYAHGPLGRGVELVENALRVVLYLLEYVVIYPVLIIAWYVVFVGLLAFLSLDLGAGQLLLVAMAVVAAVRVTAYYDEDLSRDLAKMLPLALLGVVLLEGAPAITVGESLVLVGEVAGRWRRVVIYLLFLVALEFVLRLARIVATGRVSTVEADDEPGADDVEGPPGDGGGHSP